MTFDFTAHQAVRSYLFVPGDRPERFDKAWASRADALILDLEDAVLPAKRGEARSAIANWLRPERKVWIRTNPCDTDWFAEDLRLLAEPGVAGVLLPKAESIPGALHAVVATHGLAVIPLIETAHGLECAKQLAVEKSVARLAFGSIDFQVDVGIEGEDDALLFARSQLVHASRLARIGRPVDGVTADIQNRERLIEDTRRSRRLGFGAKLCIHPSQLDVVHDCLSPSHQERDWAKRVLNAVRDAGASAITVDGKMVDVPVVKKAEHILSCPLASASVRG